MKLFCGQPLIDYYIELEPTDIERWIEDKSNGATILLKKNLHFDLNCSAYTWLQKKAFQRTHLLYSSHVGH